MHNYFSKFETLIDLQNSKYAQAYRYKNNTFYIENNFNEVFSRLEKILPDEFELIKKELFNQIEKNKLVVFCINEEYTPIYRPDAIFLTLIDLANKVNVDIENKSRGSDYGD